MASLKPFWTPASNYFLTPLCSLNMLNMSLYQAPTESSALDLVPIRVCLGAPFIATWYVAV